MNNGGKGIIFLYIVSILAVILSIFALLKNDKTGGNAEPLLEANNIVLKEENNMLKWKSDSDNTWHILYDLSKLTGKDGKDGSDGNDGANGKNGVNGKDGVNGIDGKNGIDGINGINGINGQDGKDGKDGIDGVNGTNGKDGQDGKDGKDGKDGIDGVNGTNGKDGKEVELRASGTIIQWKYTDENDSAWRDLINVEGIGGGSGNSGNNGTTESIVVSVDGNSSDLGCYNKGTSCTNGTLFTVKVNESTTLDFYVIDSDADTVTLIADSNIGNSEYTTVAWYSASAGNNSYGPITALNALNILTNDWTNISPLNYTYNNTGVGYKKLVVTDGTAVVTDVNDSTTTIGGVSRARLLTHEEAYSLGCRTTASASNCPAWLYANLGTTNNSLTPYGYWLLTSYNSTNRVYNIRNTGILANNSPNDTTGRGIRPVIVINKI